ncbi:Crp/Fnr family transcriptional regulator [Flammeovirga sp. EKP202]|uniref:Crp/Fnr family transcriptional regulator n=1 Tax=Flammeovirga sp. EKP202 TaxID=2770592 RepID=UPI00165FF036|nr:Crp/Fnr family transcriptional regulator [Flammeovirga sp. EKP202]MBD0400310.1 Crp/Fnr family transcriptional regulator [Flammeovirga sp. EKP202]
MEQLLKQLEAYTSLTESEQKVLEDALFKRNYSKNEMIFTEGKISDEIYFVTKGCVRLFYNVDGNDKTAFFYTEGQFICAGESYTYNVPAIENYQALEETEIYVFTKTMIENLIGGFPKLEIIARVATENELITYQKVLASFITKTAEERYQDLLKTKGDLVQRVPQQYIASFLGVSPETLSRIKARIYKKEHS